MRAEQRALEAAAIRRRWITLGEVLGVIAVTISALTLWNGWSERSESKAAKSAEAKQTSAKAATLLLLAGDSGRRELALRPASTGQSIQSQKILLPGALKVAPVETTGEPRIEAKWFESALIKAREAAHMPDDSRGDERLPVVIITRFLTDGVPHEDVALYDLGYTVTGRLLSGHNVALRGLSFVSRATPENARSKLDQRWKTLIPSL
ncbi:hypothetical protein CVN68_09655 [Sphingomonas psychrotolerans]|uniref:Uncharacterized protein n=1 Tax=Sphingomonas psychrotolerans TaxID=1327635 RepID=A0A2K8MP45_9SPHN|nr:hypothetical protein CVN68_09655 [Sphingomonas psychrotolerans]